MELTETERYALAISDAILSLFNGEGNINLQHLDLDKIDATKFFTGMVQGCNIVFQKLTQENKDLLQFTYLLNQLVVQDLLDNK